MGATRDAFTQVTRGFGWSTMAAAQADRYAYAQFRHFAQVIEAHPHVDAWATLGGKGHEPWFPASYVERIEALKWSGAQEGRPIRCVVGIPCEAIVSKAMGNSSDSWLCARPAVPGSVYKEMGTDVPACKMHMAGQARREANEQAWRADWAERDRKDEQNRELGQASREWAQRLRDELGIDAHGLRGQGDGRLLVAIQPERLYRQLVDLLGTLRDVGLEDEHPFQPGSAPDR